MPKRVTATEKLELVEIHNLYLSLHRLTQGQAGTFKLRRALYYALLMEDSLASSTLTNLRVALDIP